MGEPRATSPVTVIPVPKLSTAARCGARFSKSPRRAARRLARMKITVVGAYGHTGRFVVAELRRRGVTPIVAGRDAAKLADLGEDARVASVDDAGSLDRALAGASAVINCAGPFAQTVGPVVDAAKRARIPYLDVTGEVEVARETFERHAHEPAIAVLPAMGFFGGLGDLLATVAMGGAPEAELSIAYGLDGWRPTVGTRAAGQASRHRRGGRRLVLEREAAELREDAAPIVEWTFPEPFGAVPALAQVPTADCIAIRRHLRAPRIATYVTRAAIVEATDAATPVREPGRSPEAFVVEVTARRGGEERRARASGQDIYAITAPIVVEAALRIVGSEQRGALAAGQAFDAASFLRAIDGLAVYF